MSNNLKTYMPLTDRDEEMAITAFVGETPSVQFTIGDKYCMLGEKAIEDLIQILNYRIKGIPGYLATDSDRDEIFIQRQND